MTLPELDKTLGLLRAQGVQRYRDVPGEGFEVTFFASTQAPEPEQKQPAQVDADMCPCGHPIFAHVNDLCAEGCGPEQCEAKKK